MKPADIKSLGQKILQDISHINELKTLFELCQSEKPQVQFASIQVFQFVTKELLKKGYLVGKASEWFKECIGLYLGLLNQLLQESDDLRIKLESWTKSVDLIARLSEQTKEFQNQYFIPVCKTILVLDKPSALVDEIVNLLNQADDFRFYFYKNAQKHLENRIKPMNVLVLLSQLKPQPREFKYLIETELVGLQGNKSDSIQQKGVYRKMFSECWIMFLKHSMNATTYKLVLEMMHTKLIPFMEEPVLLMDFLVDAYDQGGLVSILALNGLFTLINEHNLDYPHFYDKLYNLFDRNILHVKYRSRFFRMAGLFLSSTHIPAYLVASFIKKMVRLCLYAPPSGILIVLPLCLNLFRMHPQVISIIHTRELQDPKEDSFVFEEQDPSKTNANESSLWEILVLENHYHHVVSKMARSFRDSLAKPPFDLEDFLDHSYKTVTPLMLAHGQ
ncbi:CBF/Mak21 family-domain-containing protein [Gorgonomyces haynaldii]|nr:CBF/Mak21 family-domain-containing protein [Gorgonomyces haynaldii]